MSVVDKVKGVLEVAAWIGCIIAGSLVFLAKTIWQAIWERGPEEKS